VSDVELDDYPARLRSVIMRLARRLNSTAAPEGLTPTQASALGVVVARGPLSVTELAQIEGVNPTMVSRIVGQLSASGLIHRVPNPEDLRSVRLEGTPAGSAMHVRIRDERDRKITESLGELSAAERSTLLRALPALEQLAEEIGAVSPRS
jgi:DNA-binding MarR family transcriptional regulator